MMNWTLEPVDTLGFPVLDHDASTLVQSRNLS